MDGRTDGWMDGRTDGRTDRQIRIQKKVDSDTEEGMKESECLCLFYFNFPISYILTMCTAVQYRLKATLKNTSNLAEDMV